jgi:2-polyprenyl-3-methyl-5-hydroxy-6-metoxy-1,4-benzoquinol methylase
MTTHPGEKLHSDQACTICHSHELQIVSRIDRRGQPLTTAICTGCGLVHSHPIPTQDELEAYYRQHYRSDYKQTTTPKRKYLLRYAQGAVQRLRRLEAARSGRLSVLDVGSGSGEFVYAAKLAGHQVTGIEPHQGYSKYVADTFGLTVYNDTIETAPILPESQDVITLNHVLEHMRDPVASLSRLNSWLRPGGILFVEVPDIEHRNHAPDHFFHYAHIYNFNHRTLEAVLRKAGFEVLPTPCRRPTSVIARKIGAPTPELAVLLPDNYQHLARLLARSTTLAYYLSPAPYLRLLGKAWRYPREYLLSRRITSAQQVVTGELERTRKAA